MTTKQFKPEDVNVSEEWQDAFAQELQESADSLFEDGEEELLNSFNL